MNGRLKDPVTRITTLNYLKEIWRKMSSLGCEELTSQRDLAKKKKKKKAKDKERKICHLCRILGFEMSGFGWFQKFWQTSCIVEIFGPSRPSHHLLFQSRPFQQVVTFPPQLRMCPSFTLMDSLWLYFQTPLLLKVRVRARQQAQWVSSLRPD